MPDSSEEANQVKQITDFFKRTDVMAGWFFSQVCAAILGFILLRRLLRKLEAQL